MTGMYEEEEYIEDRSCCRAQVGCLCGTSSCRLCCRFCPSVSESTSTRIVYIVFLMLSVVIMALMMSIRVQKAIMGMFPDHSVVCEWIGAGKNCEAAMGYMAVYRLGFAISCYHFLLMFITCGVKSSRDCRAGFHNGMWFYKFLLLITICIGSFFIPDPMDLFIYVWMYTAMSGAALFIVIQLMLLVFMYHSWTDKLMARVDKGGSPFCWYGVFSLTAATIVYSACACCVFLMYYYFTLYEGWDIICWLIFINVAACIVVSLVAVSKQGPKDFRLRLLHSSLISLYVMYLTWTAIASVPHNYRNSDKWENSSVWIGAGHDVRSDYPDDDDDDDDEGDDNEEKIWAEEILPYVSLALTLITVMYSVVRTATPDNCQAIEFPSCPSRQSIQRYDVEDIGGQKVVRNESNGLAYSYPLFHVMLSLATLFLMMSLTDWYTPSTARLLRFGRSWSAVWVKMSSSWVCLVIYFTVTIFPTMLPNRNYRTSPVSGNMGNGYAGSIRGSSRSLDDEAAVPLSPSKPTTTIHQETTV